ncbi:C1D-domain-containing protein [Punctularia strigosozonata HHB-11173 SS5]|uniref:C1D-domain-containing protein n=1 Tax=Punctularia strigosozonata (strain HHB-11173) TaxID=741275 RepID=UPI000441787E|nr:C1D-domain-containing protein [Punctularia strigosozonata HHB-11173 SS5]EIN14413.1 C1D-domain-containing protein [Punctularia strigosozonata HHB-11173 SS5]
MSTSKLKAKVSGLNKSLDELEAQLEPLLAQSLPETSLGLDVIQQAKLHVLVPYVTYDLIFIYLRAMGIDPMAHPIIQELERVKKYFEKIKEAEDPARRSLVVDKGVASRFIKHAISQARVDPPTRQENTHIRFNEEVPVKVTSKMRERADYQKKLTEEDEDGSEDGEALKVIEDESEEEHEEEASGIPQDKGKAKADDYESGTPEETASRAGEKRRRPVDPFTGYGSAIRESDTANPSSVSKKPRKQRKKTNLATSIGGA